MRWPCSTRSSSRACGPSAIRGVATSHSTSSSPTSAACTASSPSISDHFEHGTLERGLPRSDLPVLFIHGEHDPLPLRTTTDTAALIARARVVVVEGAGHLPWFEQPDGLREAVSDFVYG